jgi:hypothetical protein
MCDSELIITLVLSCVFTVHMNLHSSCTPIAIAPTRDGLYVDWIGQLRGHRVQHASIFDLRIAGLFGFILKYSGQKIV